MVANALRAANERLEESLRKGGDMAGWTTGWWSRRRVRVTRRKEQTPVVHHPLRQTASGPCCSLPSSVSSLAGDRSSGTGNGVDGVILRVRPLATEAGHRDKKRPSPAAARA